MSGFPAEDWIPADAPATNDGLPWSVSCNRSSHTCVSQTRFTDSVHHDKETRQHPLGDGGRGRSVRGDIADRCVEPSRKRHQQAARETRRGSKQRREVTLLHLPFPHMSCSTMRPCWRHERAFSPVCSIRPAFSHRHPPSGAARTPAPSLHPLARTMGSDRDQWAHATASALPRCVNEQFGAASGVRRTPKTHRSA